MAALITHDLEFILQQILIAEAHPDGTGTFGPGPNQIPTLILPWGLRTVDGSDNNLVPGQEEFGAADNLFPRMTPAEYRDDQDGDIFQVPIGGGAFLTATNTNYDSGDTTVLPDGFFVSGDVVDGDPRTISNLIVDQSVHNPAAIAAWEAKNETTFNPLTDDIGSIENTAPDVGLSAPFNSWFTFFGQFFDHGLDLVTKGGDGTVYMPLAADDPLRVYGPDGIAGNGDEVPASRAFMTLTRTTQIDDPNTPAIERDTENTTTSFVDQNQTYTSHPSHQAFLREYALDATGSPVSTGKLLDGAAGSMPTWLELKNHIATTLGIQLTDYDVTNVPLLATDAYGNLVLSANGRAQLVTGLGVDGALGGDDDTYLEGDPSAPVSTATALRTNHAFLNDIAHAAGPFYDHDRNPSTDAIPAAPDGNAVVNPAGPPLPPGQYDNELLDAHYVTGDGRGNENIGLTAVHHLFHSEHNRQVGAIKQAILDEIAANGFNSSLQSYLLPTANLVDGIQDSDFNGARLFQAARFATEMQYQHLVFEEFARKIMPSVNIFSGYHTEVDPSIVAEFAHTVYRFGHSMLTNTIDRINPDGSHNDIGLIPAFLNPLAFAGTGPNASGVDGAAAAGAIIRGSTQQVGNEIDEFVVDAVRNNLLGLPLDLPSINMARGRDTGIPSLNSARRTFYEATNHDAALKPYDNWAEFGLGLRHPESLINFVAAYGTHSSITGAVTMQEKREAATLLVNGDSDIDNDGLLDIAPADRVDYMNGTGAWANVNGLTTTGLDDIDFWMGGLAEKSPPFGGMLGSTFGFVFEISMENLQNGDRFYYLSRTLGLNFLHELENNSFTALIMRNTTGLGHLPADAFSTPAYIFEAANLGTYGPIPDDPNTPYDESELLIRTPDGTIVYPGAEHVVMGGTAGNDKFAGSEGDDSLWGDGGNDHLQGGSGNDTVMGGDGNDILTDAFGDDVMKGGAGHDVINSGPGLDLILAGTGSDFAMSGDDLSEFFGGGGNDFIFGGADTNTIFGNEGDDWIEGGGGADLLQGDNGDPFQVSSVTGNDVIIGGDGADDFDSESGDDIMISGPGTERNEGMLGFDWVTYKGDTSNGVGMGHNADLGLIGLLPPQVEDSRDRFDLVEGLSGGDWDDILTGNDFNNAADGVLGNELTNIRLINGLQGLLNGTFGQATTVFDSGNIILGGDGNDLIEGGGGNDIIDGNKWLSAHLSWIDQNNVEHHSDSMLDPALQAALFSGAINPSQVKIVREIVAADGTGDINTAVYNDIIENYVFERNDATGTWTVTDAAPLDVLLDSLGANIGPIDEGTDTLRNIQQLRFMTDANGDGIADLDPSGALRFETFTLAPFAANVAAAGTVTINDNTPTQGQLLTASSALSDANGSVNLASRQYAWQVETAPGIWATVLSNSATFTPSDAQVGQALRVVATFEDNLGNAETRISAATAAVSNINDAPSGTNNTVTTPEDTALVFSATNFGFTDPDTDSGDSLSAVRIDALSVSAGGSLTLNGAAVAAGAIIAAGDIGSLRFTPAANYYGTNTASLDFSVRDQTGVFDATPNILRVNVSSVNDAPAGADNTVTLVEGSSYSFSAADFGFTDVEPWDAMRSIRITNLALLPGSTLTVSGAVVTEGMVVTTPNIPNLVFRPAPGSNGSASFSFAVQDLGLAFDPTPQTLTMVVTQHNNAPVGVPSINDITPTEGAALTASVAGISDADGLAGASFTYQWQMSSNGTAWSPISGASNSTFTPTQAQVAQQLRVVVSYTDDQGTTETVASEATAMVGDLYNGNNRANARTLTNGADLAYGNAGNDVLIGLYGDDELHGGAGADLLDGGNGNDILSGDAGADTLLGSAGNDTMDGGAGDDTLIGGTGADTMAGGDGADSYDVDDAGDAVIELAAGGTDEIQTTLLSYSLNTAALANVENLSFSGTDPVAFTGTGNALVNVIFGGDGDDILDGLGGNDSMNGGLGNDTYFVTQQGEVTELEGEGTDTVVSGVSYTIAALPNIENITLTGATNINATGNTAANALVGNAGNNVLTGGDGTDVLDGQGGNDTLNGGLGADAMAGGLGNDIYVVEDAGDTVNEGVGQGTDTIQTTFTTFSLATHANVENLAFTPAASTASFTGTGNTLSNVITGGAGNDFLDGAEGIDQAIGGLGDDTYFVDQTGDLASESGAAGSGTDTVHSTANTYTLGTNVENLTFAGSGNFTGNGNTSDNSITGGAGNDILNGNNGLDRLTGGAGNDSMNGGNNADVFVFNATGFGTDSITGFDADPAGAGNNAGQDRLDISLLGVNAGNFAARVSIAALGATSTQVIVSDGLVTDGIINITAVLPANITVDDFILAA